MRGSVLQILDFHSYHCTGERPIVPGLLQLSGQKLWRQWWVESVRQQDKLKLHLSGKIKITLVPRSLISASQSEQRPNLRQATLNSISVNRFKVFYVTFFCLKMA